MSLTKLLWVWTCIFIVAISLWFLRLLNVLGSDADTLMQWISALGLILCGVFVGVFISEKKIRVQAMMVIHLFLFAIGFLVAPFVGIAVLMAIENLGFDTPAIFGVSVSAYLLLYMGLGFWLKKKGILKLPQAR